MGLLSPVSTSGHLLVGIFKGNGSSYQEHLQCPCNNGNTYSSPPFVGNDYFCESVTAAGAFTFYPNAPLWDDQACEGGGRCCLLNNPPWFTKNLTNTTTDGIELRLCMNTISGDIALELLELYIQ